MESLLEWCKKTDSKISNEWDYEKNYPLKPNDISRGSHKIVWWICNKCKNSWDSSIISRTGRNQNCPYCSNKRVLVGFNDLETTNPKIVKQWHPTKNGDLTPKDIVAGSKKRIWWKCTKCTGEWEATPHNRTYNHSGCPFCANRTVLTGFNDLGTTNPELAKQWHPTKNGNLTPRDVVAGSNQKAWWICSRCKNEWESTIDSRNNGRGCPVCGSSFTISFNEKAVAFYISKITEIITNYHPDFLANMELDIFIPQLNYAIEYDGVRYHNQSIVNDNKKDILCKENNVTLIRIREDGLPRTKCSINYFVSASGYQSLERVINDILSSLCTILKRDKPDVDIKHDYTDILKLKELSVKDKSVQQLLPHLLNEWNYERNYPILPDAIYANTNHRIWWKCSTCGYEWQSAVSSRARGHGCPACAGEVVKKGDNDLQTRRPDIAKEWNYKKNANVTPSDVCVFSNKKYWWIGKCGHEWDAKVANRTKHESGCPYCSNPPLKILPGFNDLISRDKNLAKEWNYTKNQIDPTTIGIGYSKKVWWICSKCDYEWEATVNNRSNNGTGCPNCFKMNRKKAHNEND